MARARRKKKKRKTVKPAMIAVVLLVVATAVTLTLAFWPSDQTGWSALACAQNSTVPCLGS